MSARPSPKGNGDNAFSYTCNVRARARAHAHALGVEHAVASVATVANTDEWLTNPQFETVAQSVASGQTVAITGNAPNSRKLSTRLLDTRHCARPSVGKRDP
jgi:hypothetical protein